jgi:transposase, IS5 family
MKRLRSAIKTDLFAADQHREEIERLGDALVETNLHIDFSALTVALDRVAPRPVCS